MLLAVVLLAVGCGKGSTAPTPTTKAGGGYSDLVPSLCEARSEAGQPDRVRQVFFDRSHQMLHELAADTTLVDRAAAARLLEAKQAVEQDIEFHANRLPQDLDTLLDTVGNALTAVGEAVPRSCAPAPR